MKKAFLFLMSLLAVFGVQAQTSPYTGSEATAGDFFIYNVESGYFLQNNNRVNDWNSQVQLDVQGFDWQLIPQEGGTYQLNPKFGNNHSLNSGDANGYMDTGQPVSSWTLTPVDGVSNGYTISSNGTTLGTDADKFLIKNASGSAAVFQLVTAEERFEKLTYDEPTDMSWLIPGANCNVADDHFTDLIITNADKAASKLGSGQSNNPGNGAREVWYNTSGSWEIGTTLTGMPNGVYRFTVSGYYRDGSVGEIGEKHDAGTENLRPVIYINGKTQPIMSICQRKTSGNGCDQATGSYFVPNSLSNACIACSAGFYVNPSIKVVVTDGTITLGVKVTDGVPDDWCVLDYLKLVYYGPDNIDQYVSVLNATIAEAEAWDSSITSGAMAEKLNNAIAAAKEKLTSTDSDEVEAATEALAAALAEAQSLDISVLKATIALANQEGIDTTEANDFVANTLTSEGMSDLLFDLRAARKIAAQRMPDIYTGAEPAEGNVYFYNLGTGMFLGTGASYNTHCAVDQVGIEVELIAAEGGYKMKTNRGGGWLAKGNQEASVYVDSPTQQVWHFIAVDGATGVYNISFDGTATNLLGHNPKSINDGGGVFWSSIGIKRDDSSDPNNQWKIITAEERAALLATASKTQPIDASYLIKSPSLNAQDSRDTDWTKEVSGGNGGAWVNNTENHGFEVWNSDSFKFYQTLENLNPGIYELSVSGFWREGDGANQASIVNAGGTLNQKAYLFANDAQALLDNIASCPDFVPGIASQVSAQGNFPNWPSEALEYFETGAFKTSVKVVVDESGKLTIGVGLDEKVTFGDWVVVDNFRLTYLGNDEADVSYERALSTLKDGQNYVIFTEVDGQKYYLTNTGYLSASESAATSYTFNKVAGAQYPYGFHVSHGLDTRFTNAPGTNDSNLTCGHICTSTSSRPEWEAQVFFLNADGKYAVRSTNTLGAASSWGYIGKAFWTVEAVTGAEPIAQYGFDKNYIWQIEETTADPRPEAYLIAMSWLDAVQSAKGLVTDGGQWSSNAKEPSEGAYANLLDNNYGTYFHSAYSTSADADHYLQAELTEPTQEFYFYYKKRSQNNDNRPTNIVISGSNDGTTFTDIKTIEEGLPTDAAVLDYMSERVVATEAYKYIRFTVKDTNNQATEGNGHVFFTFSEFYILPAGDVLNDALDAAGTYKSYTDISVDDVENIIKLDAQLKALLNTVKVTYTLYAAGSDEPIAAQTVIQEGGSEIAIPTDFTGTYYNGGFVPYAMYDFTTEGTIGDTDCTIKVIRTPAAGLVHALTDLSNEKAYNIYCNRGILVTKDGTIGSSSHATLHDAEPTDFAIVSYEDNYYLYSVPDAKFVLNNGSLSELPVHGVYDAIHMGAQTDPYFLYTFQIDENTTYGLNTNGSGALNGCVINNWITPDNGDQYYMVEAADFDATAALAALEAYFNPSYLITYVVKDAEDNELFKSEPCPIMPGAKVTTLPADYQRPYMTYDEVDITITEENTTATFTATWDGPFTFSTDVENATWYNMTIRNTWWVGTEGKGEAAEPYYPVQQTDDDTQLLANEAYQWAFMGNAYKGITLINKAAGEGNSLTKVNDNAVMREGTYAWTIAKNGDGFTLREPGTDSNCINQSGGGGGPLSFWSSSYSLTDQGSTFRVQLAPEPVDPVKLYAPVFNAENGTQNAPYMLGAYEPLTINYTADNVEANGYNPDELKVKVQVTLMGDLTTTQTLGSETAHSVTAETFYIPLGETEFPVALKQGYKYQMIRILTAQLVKPGTPATDDAEGTEDEVIAVYVGTPPVLRFVGVEEAPDTYEMAINVERVAGMGYTTTIADADLNIALKHLGVEELTTDMIRIVNPDETEISDYAPYDGWFAIDGTPLAWTSNPSVCVKFFESLPDGTFSICDKGLDGGTIPAVGETFTCKWALVKDEKKVVYTINVAFIEAPPVQLDIVDEMVQTSVEYASTDGSYTEKTVVLTDEQVATILQTLGLESLTEAYVYGWNPTTEEIITNYEAYDGWRDANGDFCNWSGSATVPACVKYIDGATYLTYNIQGSFSGDIKTYWLIANAEHKAIRVEVTFIVTASDVQKALEEEIAKAQALEAEALENYSAEEIAEALATLQAAIQDAIGKLGTNDEQMAEAKTALEAAEAAFADFLTAIYGINADQLAGTIYDLSGRKMEKVQRGGIYIVNGKKVLVK